MFVNGVVSEMQYINFSKPVFWITQFYNCVPKQLSMRVLHIAHSRSTHQACETMLSQETYVLSTFTIWRRAVQKSVMQPSNLIS